MWCSLTLVQVIINKVKFEDLVETNQVLGPVFFCLFVVLMLFVILVFVNITQTVSFVPTTSNDGKYIICLS
jgi:uncharacterized membrane protein YqhA